jgi:hypothetical protein
MKRREKGRKEEREGKKRGVIQGKKGWLSKSDESRERGEGRKIWDRIEEMRGDRREERRGE